MTPTQTATPLTAEEFARLPDPASGEQQELVQGVIVHMPPPQGLHGNCCAVIGSLLFNFARENKLGRIFTNDTGFIVRRNPDTVRGPDVAFWSRERLPQIPAGAYIPIPPDLAVEVVSPGDHFSRIQGKIADYLACGVALLWVIDPEDRSVSVYRPGQPLRILQESDHLDGEDVLPGFRLPVRELFAG
jgi:Uma2 family endonuclease